MTEDRFDPETLIQDVFAQLRQLYHDGHAQQIEDEICFMTQKDLHRRGSEDCAVTIGGADAIVFDPEADVISEHLTNGNEITDLAAEAIVRRLVTTTSLMEVAHFKSWLETFDYELRKKER